MFERLIESWLDSAGERTYQAPFCQMLAAQRYTVLHSTRHSPIEFGKDVIAKAPDGTLCAYQLKGNPSSRITARQLRDIQGQLIQLVSQPIRYPGLNIQPHKSYLVTNGEIDEEAQRALMDIGDGLALNGYKYPSIEVISRGTLLNWAQQLGSSLWPAELEDINLILEMLVYNGRDLFPIDKLHDLLTSTLRLNASKKSISADEVRRRVSSAAMLVGICLRNFTLAENHYAILTAWTAFAAYAIAICERFEVSFKRNGMSAVQLAKVVIFDSLCDLCEELIKRGHLVEGNVLTDAPFYKARYLLLSALMAILWFWCEDDGWPNLEYKDFIQSFIPRTLGEFWFWGEGAIPQLLIYIWFLRSVDPTPQPDVILANLLHTVIAHNTTTKGETLAGPYFTAENVIRHQLHHDLGMREDPLRDWFPSPSSYCAEGLFHLLVRTGLKQGCKRIWPGYSRLGLRSFEPEATWQYCLWRSKNGVEQERQLPASETWSKVTIEARDVQGRGIPRTLLDDKFLLMLLTIIMPHRATASAIRYLGWRFNKTWFIDSPIE